MWAVVRHLGAGTIELRRIGISGLLLLGACSSAPKVKYRIDPDDLEARACVAYCDQELNRCRGQLARAYQKCLQRWPGDALDQQRCYERSKPEAMAKLPVQTGVDYPSCEARYDGCFEACGGTVIRPEEEPHS